MDIELYHTLVEESGGNQLFLQQNRHLKGVANHEPWPLLFTLGIYAHQNSPDVWGWLEIRDDVGLVLYRGHTTQESRLQCEKVLKARLKRITMDDLRVWSVTPRYENL